MSNKIVFIGNNPINTQKIDNFIQQNKKITPAIYIYLLIKIWGF